jgi:probable HAF family extracellular repeat protein
MNCKKTPLAIGLTLFAVVSLPVVTTAQNQKQVNSRHHHYQVLQIPTLGGAGTNFFDNTNNVAALNGRGSVSNGCSGTLLSDPNSSSYWWSPDGTVCHAFLWQDGSLTDLGALPGTNNSGAAWISSNGLVAGLSENGQIDPSIPGLPQISAVMWRDGKITNLGTLPGGGYQSAAVSVNNRGEVAGIASNLIPDVNSLLKNNPNLWAGVGYGYQLRAFIWNQENGMQDLGTLGTGTDAQAIRINEPGQVIGDSYTSSDPGACFGVTSGAFIWDRKHGMVDLGSFGGTCAVADDLNNHGQVVGAGLVAGDAYQRAFLWQNGSLRDLGGSLGGNNSGAIAVNENGQAVGLGYLQGETTFHATLWKKVGQMTDLGTVGGDPCSFAQGINDKGQAVGDSSPSDCVSFDTSRGFLWENGSIADLNTLVPSNSPLYFIYAYAINNRGEIAANGIDANGIEQAAVLIPCDEHHPGVEGCDYSLADAKAQSQARVHVPSGTQRLPQSRGMNRYHIPVAIAGQIVSAK